MVVLDLIFRPTIRSNPTHFFRIQLATFLFILWLVSARIRFAVFMSHFFCQGFPFLRFIVCTALHNIRVVRERSAMQRSAPCVLRKSLANRTFFSTATKIYFIACCAAVINSFLVVLPTNQYTPSSRNKQ